MDERADRCRALHGVGQPDVQRELGRLPYSTTKEQKADSRERAFESRLAGRLEYRLVIERVQVLAVDPKLRPEQENSDEETNIT